MQWVNVFLQTLKWILQVIQEFMYPRQGNKDENHNENDNLKNTKSTIPGPWSLPILGASWLYTSIGPYSHVEYHTSNFDKFKKYGPVVREEVLWNYPLIHLFDAADIDTVLKYKSDTPYRPHNEADVFYRKYRKDLYDNIGMVNENGENWKNLRKHLSPPLTNRKTAQHYASDMNEIADELIDILSTNKQRLEQDTEGLSSLVYRAGLEMMCNVALERRMGFLSSDEAAQNKSDMLKIMTALKGYQTASNSAMYGLPLWKYIPAKFSDVFTQLVTHRDNLFYTIGSLVDGTTASGNVNDLSILGQLINNKDLSTKEVKVSCVDYITAGVDTVGNSLIYAIWLISSSDSVQKRLREELESIGDSDLTQDTISTLTYLKACVKESFRMYPTASQIARLTEKPLTVSGGHVLPANSLVLCHTHVACHQEENFTQATEFIPQRWIPEERPKNWVHKAHLVVPFGSGKRICPGKRLAEQEIHIIIAKIFRNFHLTPKDDLEIEFNWLMSPSGPLRFSLEKVSEHVEN